MTVVSQALVASARYIGPFPTMRRGSWTILGQDGGQSIDLGDRTLFLFSDTLIASTAATDCEPPEPRSPIAGVHSIFRANCAACAATAPLPRALGSLEYFVDDAEFPREILVPTAREAYQALRFWPEHGVLVDGCVYLFYLGVQTIDPSSVWGFRTAGVGLAAFNPATGRCVRLGHDGDWRFWKPVADDFHFGVQAIRKDPYAYVFAAIREGLTITGRLARVGLDRITDVRAYEYLASHDPRWSARSEDACSLGTCSMEYSVSYNPHLQAFMMTFVDGFSKQLMMRVADEVWGPYSEARPLIGLPHEDSSVLLYLAFEHPSFREAGGQRIFLSYCQPHFMPPSLISVTFTDAAANRRLLRA